MDYLLLLSLIVAVLGIALQAFEPQKQRLVEGLKINVTNMVSNGSLSEDHPLESGRVKEIK